MKKIGVYIFIFTIILETVALAGPTYQWSIPDNVRVVQTAPVDNVRVFSTIQGAIDSIPTASPSSTNPYVIKVMPGKYSTTFTLPNYVSLVGSGKESTIIDVPIQISGNATLDNIKFLSNSASMPLLTTGENSIVELNNINIVIGQETNNLALLTGSMSKTVMVNVNINVDQNRSIAPSSNVNHIIRIGNTGSLEMKNCDFGITFNRTNHAFVIHANEANKLIINNSRIRNENVYGATMLFDGGPPTAEITNSQIELEAVQGIVGVDLGRLKISGSKITANSMNPGWIEVVHGYNGDIYIDNSVITATVNGMVDSSAFSLVLDGGSGEITNSNFTGPVGVVWGPNLKIGNSKISGGISYLDELYGQGTYKYFGCYDDNYQPCQYPATP